MNSPTISDVERDRLAKDRADWLLDAVACATQDRRFLRGDPEYDEVAGRAILMNAEKAINVALNTALSAQKSEREEARNAGIEDAARYVEGAGGVIPGASVFAPVVSGNNMPCMSGDARDRLHAHKRRYFDDATNTLASAIRNLKIEVDDAG